MKTAARIAAELVGWLFTILGWIFAVVFGVLFLVYGFGAFFGNNVYEFMAAVYAIPLCFFGMSAAALGRSLPRHLYPGRSSESENHGR